MRSRLLLVLCYTLVAAGVAEAQALKGPGQRPELQLSLQQLFPLTTIGEGVLGLRGTPDSIRQAGGVVVLRREGVSGSMERKNAATLHIGLEAAPVASGRQDIKFRPGERFYVHSIYVGSDVITFALMSTQMAPVAGGTHRLWATLNFFFKAETLHQGDRDAVLALVQQWIVPETLGTAMASGAPTALANPLSAPAGSSQSNEIQLEPGMGIEQAIEAMGAPLRRITFGQHAWLYYPGLILAFTNQRLEAVDRLGGPPAAVVVESAVPHAEILVDGKLVGETPATLEIPAGRRRITVRKAGWPEWTREVELLSGSRVTLTAQLDKP
jgi:hypothetical protein